MSELSQYLEFEVHQDWSSFHHLPLEVHTELSSPNSDQFDSEFESSSRPSSAVPSKFSTVLMVRGGHNRLGPRRNLTRTDYALNRFPTDGNALDRLVELELTAHAQLRRACILFTYIISNEVAEVVDDDMEEMLLVWIFLLCVRMVRLS